MGLAKELIIIVNLLSKEGVRQVVFTPRLHSTAPVFPPLLHDELSFYQFVTSVLYTSHTFIYVFQLCHPGLTLPLL